MADDKYWGEWVSSLNAIGVDYRKSPHWETVQGTADCMILIGGLTIPVELKTAGISFSYASRDGWKPEQRAWADRMLDKHGMETHLALFIGSDPPNYNPEKYRPRRLYVMPFREYLSVEEKFVERSYSTIPYRAPNTRAGYDISLFDERYRWVWQGGGQWAPGAQFRLRTKSVVIYAGKVRRQRDRLLKLGSYQPETRENDGGIT